MEPLLALTLTPLFMEHKIWSQKKGHIIFVFVTSIEGNLNHYSGERNCCLDPETQILWQTFSIKK